MQRSNWWGPIVVLAIAAAVGVWWRFRLAAPPAEPAPPRPGAESVDLLQVVRLRNRGIARLENGELQAASADFDELCRVLPQEPLGFRDRVIASLLQLEALNRASDADAFDQMLATARKNLQALRGVEPDEAAVHVLASRLSGLAGDADQAVAELQRATALQPEDASLWFELYELSRVDDTAERKALAQSALREAHAHAPDNLVVLLALLQQEATVRSAALPEILDQASPLLAGLAPGIARRVRINPLDLVAQAQQAAEAGDWPASQRALRALANITRPDDAAQSDARRIERHPLEFMLTQFVTIPGDALPHGAIGAGAEPAFAFAPVEGSAAPPAPPGIRDALFADFDLDGRDELWVLVENRLEIYARIDSGPWKVVATAPAASGMTRLLAVDLDQDAVEAPPPADALPGQLPAVCHTADLDAVLFGVDGVGLLQNSIDNGTRTMAAAPVEELAALDTVRSVTPADINSDGDLDLLCLSSAGLTAWSNRGGFAFEPLVLTETPAAVTALATADIDRDVDVDIVLGLQTGVVGYLENYRHGTFRWRAIGGGAAPVHAIDIVDSDGNASWDVLAATPGGLTLRRSRWIAPGDVQFDEPTPLSASPVTSFATGDFNNNGRLDLLCWTGEGLQACAADGGGGWRFPGVDFSAGAGAIVRAEISDGDWDGDLDLLVVGADGLTLLENRGATSGGWLEVGLLAQQVKGAQSSVSGRVNHYGLGSLLEIRSGSDYQARIVRGPLTHFGLGAIEQADALRIVWTNGIPDNVIEPQSRQFLCERQTLKGSCPYLYLWNGERFEFVTDLLWAAPIGLVNPAGELVPDREWEFLRIPGDAVREIDGEYRLSITEELWEAAYFDQVELIAVDHPAGVSVFTNEKVGPPDIAEPRLHFVRERRHAEQVINQDGRDLTELVAEADERYAVAQERKLRQGYTADGWLELRLDVPSPPRRLTLFLTGWVYPTDTSINASLHEDAALDGPRPPSLALWKQGEWRELIPFCGFPGGKTKTIAIDLPVDEFEAGENRLRLATSMELAWDEIFFTQDEEPADVVERSLPLRAAELRYRGFSAPIPHPDRGPERYDYRRVSREPRWPLMQGRFTRYGDVAELIAAADDRSVVMGSGDEMLVRFEAPSTPPPAGWTRDFILHNVGWDKDADLHTVYGQTVEPLPFRSMSRYPYEPVESFPDTPEIRAYLRDYQTRAADARRFSRISGFTSRVEP